MAESTTNAKLSSIGSSISLVARKTLTADTEVSLTGRQCLGAVTFASLLAYGLGGASGYNNAKANVEPVISMPPGLQFHKPNLKRA